MYELAKIQKQHGVVNLNRTNINDSRNTLIIYWQAPRIIHEINYASMYNDRGLVLCDIHNYSYTITSAIIRHAKKTEIIFSTISSSENSEQSQEKVDDIQIQRDRSPYVLVVRVALDEIVRVVHNVSTEYDRCQAPVYHHRELTQREENLQPEMHKNPNILRPRMHHRDIEFKQQELSKQALHTWIRENTMRTSNAPDKKGPRKLKSWPLLAAQNVYRVRPTTTTVVRITDSKITFPVSNSTHSLCQPTVCT